MRCAVNRIELGTTRSSEPADQRRRNTIRPGICRNENTHRANVRISQSIAGTIFPPISPFNHTWHINKKPALTHSHSHTPTPSSLALVYTFLWFAFIITSSRVHTHITHTWRTPTGWFGYNSEPTVCMFTIASVSAQHIFMLQCQTANGECVSSVPKAV